MTPKADAHRRPEVQTLSEHALHVIAQEHLTFTELMGDAEKTHCMIYIAKKNAQNHDNMAISGIWFNQQHTYSKWKHTCGRSNSQLGFILECPQRCDIIWKNTYIYIYSIIRPTYIIYAYTVSYTYLLCHMYDIIRMLHNVYHICMSSYIYIHT